MCHYLYCYRYERDDVGNLAGIGENDGNTTELLDNLLDVGSLGADELGVEALLNDEVHNLC